MTDARLFTGLVLNTAELLQTVRDTHLCFGASLAAAGLVLIGWPRHKGPAALHMLCVIETIQRRLAQDHQRSWLSDAWRSGPEVQRLVSVLSGIT